MNCSNFEIFNGCNNCKCSLSNTETLSLLTAGSIIDLVDQIVINYNLFPNTKLLLDKSTISCTGNISITYDIDSANKINKSNRFIYYKIVNDWLKHNIVLIHDAIDIIYLILCVSILRYNETEQKAQNMIENMQVLFNYMQFYIKELEKNTT